MTVHSLRLAEWQTINPEPGSPTAGLQLGSESSLRKLARRLAEQRYLEVLELREGLSVRSTSFVGKVRLGSVEITVIPKLPTDSLLRLLRYAYGLRDLHLFAETAQATQEVSFQELLAWQLAKEARELMARGLQRGYLRREENLASPRGRIDFQALAGRGTSVEATLPCNHYRRVEDRLINRVLLAGLRLAAAVTEDRGLRIELGRLAERLADKVTLIRLDRQVFTRLASKMNRMTRAYEPAISLIRILHEGSGLSQDDGKGGTSLPGFLFDMNRFFQALLGKFLGENLKDYEIRSEQQLTGMFAYLPGWNPRETQPPAPRPDFLISMGPKTLAILDAKYRDLWEHPLPRDMLYQLALYAMSHEGGTAAILYPTTHPQATESRIEVRNPTQGSRQALVTLRPVDLNTLERLVSARPTALVQKERFSFAQRLIFGPEQRDP